METILFGKYYFFVNKKVEPIKWELLEDNEESMLLISKYGIDKKLFHKNKTVENGKNSDIREGLNTDFYNNAFSTDEKNKILNQEHKENIIDGKRNQKLEILSKDKVFLLSEEELCKFYPLQEDRKIKITPFARRNLNPTVFDLTENNENELDYNKCQHDFYSDGGLRSINSQNLPTIVVYRGHTLNVNANYEEVNIRPVIKIKK